MSPRRGLDRDTIVQQATTLANEQGFEAVTIASLAKKLDIRPPSLYNHIDGLEGLRKQLALDGIESLYMTLTKAAVGKAGGEAVHAMATVYIQYVRENPGLYDASLILPDDPDIQKAGNQIVELTLQVLHYYKLEKEEAIHAVRGLRSILHGFASLEQKGGFGLPLNVNESLTRLIDSFLIGIEKRNS